MKPTTYLFPAVAGLLFSCSSGTNNPASTSSDSLNRDTAVNSEITNPVHRTLGNLEELNDKDTAYLTTSDGSVYLVTMEKDDETENETNSSNADRGMAARSPTSPGSIPCQGENFDGSDRKKAKTSVSSAAKEIFADLNELLDDPNRKSDDEMGTTHSPPISTDSTSGRVAEEKRNVQINQTWIYAFAREGDEDYHVIIGSTDNKNTARFFNSEVSGFPVSHSGPTFTKLNNVRTDFESHFNITSCKSGYVKFIDHPVPVSITGSMFFDKHHFDGGSNSGPQGAQPNTFWEIHPITSITFL